MPSTFQSTFSDALCVYRKRTKKDPLLHPLAVRLQPCDSPDAVIKVLQEQAQAIDQSGSGNEALTKWLSPTVNVLYALSSSVQPEEGVGMVIISTRSECVMQLSSPFHKVLSPGKVTFVGIGVLLSVSVFLASRARTDGTPKFF